MTKEEKLFKIAKIIAESDSIGEMYHYCDDYTKEWFDEEKEENGITYLSVAKEILEIFENEE